MPRAGLSQVRVVAEAEVVADEVGLANLTLASVAGRLGVRMPSLYKHINGLDGLHRDLAVRAKGELTDVLRRAAVGRAGTDALQAMAAAYRRWAKAHPGRYAATLRAPAADDADDVAASDAAAGVVFDVLGGFGLSGDDAVDATRALRAALHGFVSLEQAGGFARPYDTDHSFDRMVVGVAAMLRAWGEPSAARS